MAKQTLPVNFKDDILSSGMGGKRRYNLIQNDDGTVSLEDVTDYTQIGSDFGAAQVNQTNEAVNQSADKDAVDSLKREVDGKLGTTGNASNVVNTFSQASARSNLTTGEKLSASLGKIMKWFADLKDGAFHTVANNLVTTAPGYALDARMGKLLYDWAWDNFNLVVKRVEADGVTIGGGSVYSLGLSLNQSDEIAIGVVGFSVSNATSGGTGSTYCAVYAVLTDRIVF